MLFKQQRNDIFSAIVSEGLQPTEFNERNSESSYSLTSKKNKFSFFIANQSTYFVPTASPPVPGISNGVYMGWDSCVKECKRWVKFLRVENETPDLWEEAQANAKLFALNPVVPNEVFNDAELRQLQGQVRQLVQGLMTLGLPANAQKLLTETVNEIPEKATRFTKKELAGWFMGAFAAQVTNLALSQEHVSAIATLIKTTFMGILQLH